MRRRNRGQRILKMPGGRKRGKPQSRFMDVVMEDTRRAGVTGGCWDRMREADDLLSGPLKAAAGRSRPLTPSARSAQLSSPLLK